MIRSFQQMLDDHAKAPPSAPASRLIPFQPARNCPATGLLRRVLEHSRKPS